jgi:hypothetical protein
MLVSQSNDTPTFLLCRTEVMRGLIILVKMARHLTIAAGMTATAAGEARSFSSLWGGRASSEVVGLHLLVLALPFAELWVLPYKGLEVLAQMRRALTSFWHSACSHL